MAYWAPDGVGDVIDSVIEGNRRIARGGIVKPDELLTMPGGVEKMTDIVIQYLTAQILNTKKNDRELPSFFLTARGPESQDVDKFFTGLQMSPGRSTLIFTGFQVIRVALLTILGRHAKEPVTLFTTLTAMEKVVKDSRVFSLRDGGDSTFLNKTIAKKFEGIPVTHNGETTAIGVFDACRNVTLQDICKHALTLNSDNGSKLYFFLPYTTTLFRVASNFHALSEVVTLDIPYGKAVIDNSWITFVAVNGAHSFRLGRLAYLEMLFRSFVTTDCGVDFQNEVAVEYHGMRVMVLRSTSTNFRDQVESVVYPPHAIEKKDERLIAVKGYDVSCAGLVSRMVMCRASFYANIRAYASAMNVLKVSDLLRYAEMQNQIVVVGGPSVLLKGQTQGLKRIYEPADLMIIVQHVYHEVFQANNEATTLIRSQVSFLKSDLSMNRTETVVRASLIVSSIAVTGGFAALVSSSFIRELAVGYVLKPLIAGLLLSQNFSKFSEYIVKLTLKLLDENMFPSLNELPLPTVFGSFENKKSLPLCPSVLKTGKNFLLEDIGFDHKDFVRVSTGQVFRTFKDGDIFDVSGNHYVTATYRDSFKFKTVELFAKLPQMGIEHKVGDLYSSSKKPEGTPPNYVALTTNDGFVYKEIFTDGSVFWLNGVVETFSFQRALITPVGHKRPTYAVSLLTDLTGKFIRDGVMFDGIFSSARMIDAPLMLGNMSATLTGILAPTKWSDRELAAAIIRLDPSLKAYCSLGFMLRKSEDGNEVSAYGPGIKRIGCWQEHINPVLKELVDTGAAYDELHTPITSSSDLCALVIYLASIGVEVKLKDLRFSPDCMPFVCDIDQSQFLEPDLQDQIRRIGNS